MVTLGGRHAGSVASAILPSVQGPPDAPSWGSWLCPFVHGPGKPMPRGHSPGQTPPRSVGIPLLGIGGWGQEASPPKFSEGPLSRSFCGCAAPHSVTGGGHLQTHGKTVALWGALSLSRTNSRTRVRRRKPWSRHRPGISGPACGQREKKLFIYYHRLSFLVFLFPLLCDFCLFYFQSASLSK